MQGLARSLQRFGLIPISEFRRVLFWSCGSPRLQPPKNQQHPGSRSGNLGELLHIHPETPSTSSCFTGSGLLVAGGARVAVRGILTSARAPRGFGLATLGEGLEGR